MKGVTKRQREIVDYIQQFILNNRYSPSYREIMEHFGFSSLGSVYKHITALKRKGLISAEEHTSRSLLPAEKILKQENCSIEIPFIGHISAGMPIQTFAQNQHMDIPRSLVHAPEKTYALRVQGDFLNEEMIADGDILLIEARQQAHPGETVLALINAHDVIVKKIYLEGIYTRLISSYAQHHPIILKSEDIMVQGVVLGLLRQH